MSKVFIKIVAVLLSVAVFAIGQNVNEQKETKRYAIVKQRGDVFVKENIEPDAKIVTRALKGQKFEIIGEPGQLWLKVKTNEGDGYIPIAYCEIKEGNQFPIVVLIIIVVLLGAAGGGGYVLYKKKGLLRKEDSNPL